VEACFISSSVENGDEFIGLALMMIEEDHANAACINWFPVVSMVGIESLGCSAPS